MVDKFFHADGKTDMIKLTVVFRNFANARENNSTPKIIRKHNKNTFIYLFIFFITKPSGNYSLQKPTF